MGKCMTKFQRVVKCVECAVAMYEREATECYELQSQIEGISAVRGGNRKVTRCKTCLSKHAAHRNGEKKSV